MQLLLPLTFFKNVSALQLDIYIAKLWTNVRHYVVPLFLLILFILFKKILLDQRFL